MKEALKFIPSVGDERKHCPTVEQAKLCSNDFNHYKSQANFGEHSEYDFSRGWEFGYGAALKILVRKKKR